jgi:ribose 5-phosphate isomerase A
MTPAMTDDDPLALAAVAPVTAGMLVGLGTGRAATRAIAALARRAAVESLALACVATSRASEVLARRLGLPVRPMEGVERVDYLFDGADEVDPALRLLKGRGGAMTREKIVARVAARRTYLVQATKLVPHLGASAPLPIEVLRFGLASTLRALRERGLGGVVRAGYTTDDGNPVLDAALPATTDLMSLAAALDVMPAVVGHGLFLDEADLVLIEDASGALSRRERPR